ncbi:cation-transporting P-type ATPase ['Fragaria x ananassa' phyllody phytoplasma]|uniref:Cation-transporting P-type ATPase n=1 Tax='Fragaria x ananassa' phyllody phytoplasma TaxID=2358428 RepID=A0ABS5K3I0_9MOLU|nr:cation-transporting P-type ATPase ['Fragaria x ananassa' phyllody phytoplasma]MBS2126476.1 cation-transporting P-type ATPase ['Fragaria x ananassa' phyllody phytoplasma]
MNKKEELLHISSLNKDDVLKYLKTNVHGLTNEQTIQRQQIYGKNIIKQNQSFHFWKQFIKQFTSVMAILLWIAAFFSFCLGHEHYRIGVAIVLVIVINGLFSFSQEYKADKVLSSLGKMIPKKVQVYREQKNEMIDVTELTIGDVIFLETGTQVPVDARIIQANSFFVDNSMLSGETIPLNRNESPNNRHDYSIAEIPNLVYAGTTVTQGSCLAVVYAIGNDTQIGEVSSLSQTIDKGRSILDQEMQHIMKKVSIIATCAASIAFTISFFKGADVFSKANFKYAVIAAVGMLVANIPEGLLPTVNLTLAIGSQRMAKQNALIKKITSLETLSSTTVICTDKTGTLTQNQLTVRKILTPDILIKFAGSGYNDQERYQPSSDQMFAQKGIEKFLVASILCSEAKLISLDKKPNQFNLIGNPTEGALLIAAKKYGYNLESVQKSVNILKLNPFTSERKKMSILVKNNHEKVYDLNSEYLFIKGAPNTILEQCQMQYKNQKVNPFTQEEKVSFLKHNDNFASQGYRVLALAYKKIEQNQPLEEDMVFLGFAVNYDPPREEVKEAVYNLTQSGLKITIITGDYGLTAAAIGKQIGIIKDDFIGLDGVEVEKMTMEQLQKTLKSNKPVIFSRTTPKHKLKIVQAYRNNGEIVGVTGDGVNDILALKAAHIGIAMGKSGTDVARNAADMILLDDNFATISKAVLEGRCIYENIKKFITYVFASNIPQIFPFLAMAFLGITESYLYVLHILAIDLLTDLIPAIALGAEKTDSSLLIQKPRSKHDHLMDDKVLKRSYGFLGIVEGIVSLSLFLIFHKILNQSFILSSTMAFGAVIFAQVGNAFACRSNKFYFWQTLKKPNKILYYGILIEILFFILITQIQFLSNIFHTETLALKDYLWFILCPIILLLFDTIWKKVFVFNKKNPQL